MGEPVSPGEEVGELKEAQVVTGSAGKLGSRAEGERTRGSARHRTLLPAAKGRPSACSR